MNTSEANLRSVFGRLVGLAGLPRVALSSLFPLPFLKFYWQHEVLNLVIPIMQGVKRDSNRMRKSRTKSEQSGWQSAIFCDCYNPREL